MKKLFLSLAVGISAMLIPLASGADAVSGRADWMAGKRGMMVHWLFAEAGQIDYYANAFDINKFMADFDATKSDYLIFTIGQNKGTYASPNAKLAELGIPSGCCATRDLVGEIAAAVHARGKKFIAYLPCEVNQNDTVKTLLGWSDRATFQQNYCAVITEWATRWGTNLDGWWIDGFYNDDGHWPSSNKAFDQSVWAAAFRAGNQNAVVTMNPGLAAKTPRTDLLSGGVLSDYLAGEINSPSALNGWTLKEFADDATCRTHFLMPIDGCWGAYWPWSMAGGANPYGDAPSQSEMYRLSYLGQFPDPVVSESDLSAMISSVFAVHGAVTINIGVNASGTLNPASVALLAKMPGGSESASADPGTTVESLIGSWSSAPMAADGSTFSKDGELVYAYCRSDAAKTVNTVPFTGVTELGSASANVEVSPALSLAMDVSADNATGDLETFAKYGWKAENVSGRFRADVTFKGLTPGNRYCIQLYLHDTYCHNCAVFGPDAKSTVFYCDDETSQRSGKDWSRGGVFTGVITAKAATHTVTLVYPYSDRICLNALQVRCLGKAVTDEPFVLATYNVMYKAGFASSHPRYWQKRIPAVAELIKERSFDVFGTQEPDEDELPLLASELGGEYAHVGYGREEDHTGEGVPIFYRKARFECLKWGTFWLSSEENQDVSGSRYPGSKRPRICTWARFKDKTTGKCFRYFNTHLESEDEAARFFGMQLIMAKVNAAIARGETVFVSGDLNDTLDEMSDEKRQALVEERGPELTTDPAKSPVRLARSVLADSLDVSEAAHTGPNNTFHSWKGADAFCRLDYIFVTSNVTVKTHATLDDAYLNDGGDMKPPSDHFPVMTTVSLANCTDVGLSDDREGEGEGEQGGGDDKADPDTSWMAGSFGVSFHWTAKIVDNYGSKNWEQAVNDFDVEKFADSVESFGAKHVIFTVAHAWQQLPCPCAALDSYISGRTTPRDLMKDIIDELTNRNIRVVFYYNHSCNHNEDSAWQAASGYNDITDESSMAAFGSKICSIVRELSLRYGDGVSAWWFDSATSVDDSKPWPNNKSANYVAGLSFPWNDLFAAARAGNPHVAVAVNWDVGATDQHELATDYLSGETEKIDAYGNFFPFAPGELQDHIWTRMDSSDWFWQGGDVSGYGSRFSAEQLAWWKVSHRDAGRMATLNLVIDEAGNINPVVAGQLVNAKTIGKVWSQGRYDPTKWQAAPASSNLIRGITAEHEGDRSQYTDGFHRTPTTVLTDGTVPMSEPVAGANLTNGEKAQIFESLNGNVFTWTLAETSDIYGFNLYSRSTRSNNNGGKDGGNDAIVVSSIEVLPAGGSDWVSIGAPALSFGIQDGISGGALVARLADDSGAALATNVAKIRFTQGSPENGASLLVECEVIGCKAEGGEEPPDDPEDDDPEDIANPTKALVNHFTFNLASKRYYDCIAKRDAVMVTERGVETADVDTSVPNDVTGYDKAIAIPTSYGLKVAHSVPTNAPSSYCMVLKFYSPADSDGQWRSFYRTVNNNNDAALFVKNNNTIGGTGAWGGYGASTVSSGAWHTLIVSVDAETGTRTAYYDGALELQSDDLSGRQEDLTEKPYLYISVDDSDEDYTLYFDDIRIYNVAKPKAVFDGDGVRAGGPDDTIGEESEPAEDPDDPDDPPPGPQPGELVNGRANMKGWSMKRVSTPVAAPTVSSAQSWSGQSIGDLYKADPSDKFSSLSATSGEITMTFGEAVVANTVQLFAPKENTDCMASAFKVLGSNDGSAWTELLSVTGEADWFARECRYYTFTNEAAYTQYRLAVSAVNGGGSLKLGVFNYFFTKHADPTTPWTWAGNVLSRGDQSINNVSKESGCLSINYNNNFENIYDLDLTAGIVDADGAKIDLPVKLNTRFKGSGYLTRVVAPKNVVQFGDYGFEKCYVLNEVVFGEDLARIDGKGSFKLAASLQFVDMSKAVVPTLPSEMFMNAYNVCGDLEFSVLTNSASFQNTRITSVSFPKIECFGDGGDWMAAFGLCPNLTNIVFGANLTTVNCGQFLGKITGPTTVYWNSAPPTFEMGETSIFNDKADWTVTNYLPLGKKPEWEAYAAAKGNSFTLPDGDTPGTWTSGKKAYVRWWDDRPPVKSGFMLIMR